MKIQLTVKEALEHGFTHYSSEGDEYNKRIDKIQPEYFPESPVYLVDKDNSYYFSISAKAIEETILEKLIYEQDEVSDPDSKLAELASEADFGKLAEDINARMAAIKFSDLTDIELIP